MKLIPSEFTLKNDEQKKIHYGFIAQELENDFPEGIYNAAFEVHKIKDIAKMIKEKTGAKIEYSVSNDKRSYSQNSDKLLRLGFKSMHSVENAISEIINLYNQGLIKDSIDNYNLKKMQKIKIK